MAFEFRFPDVGEGVTEGVLLKWLVKVGDAVKADQPIAEIETDKAVVEVPSPRQGFVLALPWKQNDTIPVGKILAVIGEKGEKYVPSKQTAEEKKLEKRESVSVVGHVSNKTITLPAVGVQKAQAVYGIGGISALPRVRKLARELGVNISNIVGTGVGGQVTEEDVRKATGAAAVPAEPSIDFSKWGRVEEAKLSGIRKAIAEHMQKSVRIAPHAAAMEEADVTELAVLRKKLQPVAEKQKAHLTFLPFVVKAVVSALQKHPYINSSLDEQKQSIILKKYYNIGIAVDTEHGLMVPVIEGPHSKSLIDIAKEISMLAEKARIRKISLEEMQGGTFTITNYGSIAGLFGVPVINYPEAAILGLGRIKEKPVFVGSKESGNQKIESRKILPLSLSFDHRIIDGAEAARFLQTLIKHLEDPSLIVTD